MRHRLVRVLAALALPIAVAACGGSQSTHSQDDTSGAGPGATTNPDLPADDAGGPPPVITPPPTTDTPDAQPYDAGVVVVPAADAGDGLHGCTPDCFDQNDYTQACDSQRVVVLTKHQGFSPRCMTVATGQTVTFVDQHGGFAQCTFGPDGGGTPNPIPTTDSGETVTATFPTAGVFGYHCVDANGNEHGGAVQVVDAGNTGP